MAEKLCGTCKFRNKRGLCENKKIDEDHWYDKREKIDMLVYSYYEGGSFWVGEQFGCVHWAKKEG
jgi:hypothetical protein